MRLCVLMCLVACTATEPVILEGQAFDSDLELRATWKAPQGATKVEVSFSSWDLCRSEACEVKNAPDTNYLDVIVLHAPDTGSFTFEGSFTKNGEVLDVCTLPSSVNGKVNADINDVEIRPLLGGNPRNDSVIDNCDISFDYAYETQP